MLLEEECRTAASLSMFPQVAPERLSGYPSANGQKERNRECADVCRRPADGGWRRKLRESRIRERYLAKQRQAGGQERGEQTSGFAATLDKETVCRPRHKSTRPVVCRA